MTSTKPKRKPVPRVFKNPNGPFTQAQMDITMAAQSRRDNEKRK